MNAQILEKKEIQNKKLEKIIAKYSGVEFNDSNYYIGGGLDCSKFASNRHEDARNDSGKLTLGEANSLFSKATGLTVSEISSIIHYEFENLEWHHAGKLPKSYGGGMKKTYFLNSEQITELATNFESIKTSFENHIKEVTNAELMEKNLETRRVEFLNLHATKVVRKLRALFNSIYYVEICREMNGKYGWFDSTYKSYNLPEYITAWVFESESDYNEYLSIK